jgi:omega-hydroxy-beta-dihydromenaquinone-9 sulfotransferase
LSKNPTFCGRVEALIETFPDARFIVPMRNPYETIPSLLKMLQTEWGLRRRDERLITKSLRVLADQSIDSYQYPLDVLAKHPDVRSSVVDYRELISHPDATMRRIYQELDLDLGSAAAEAFGSTAARAGHESAHRYSLEEFGLDPHEIHTRLAALFDEYHWDTEGDDAVVR